MKSPNKGTSASPTTKKPVAQSNRATDNKDAVALLKQDHRNVEALFKTYQTADQKEKQEIVRRICNELIVHTLLEEEIFYQACRDKGVEAKDLDEAQIEHDSAKLLIGELLADSPGSQYFDAKVTVLSEYIKHHVSEEEKPSEGIFAKAKKQGLDMSALGQRLQARKRELMEKAEANELGLPTPRALQLQSNQEYQENRNMPRYSSDRDRDERGQFTSEEDDDRRYSRSRSSSRYEDDDDRRGRVRGGFGDRKSSPRRRAAVLDPRATTRMTIAVVVVVVADGSEIRKAMPRRPVSAGRTTIAADAALGRGQAIAMTRKTTIAAAALPCHGRAVAMMMTTIAAAAVSDHGLVRTIMTTIVAVAAGAVAAGSVTRKGTRKPHASAGKMTIEAAIAPVPELVWPSQALYLRIGFQGLVRVASRKSQDPASPFSRNERLISS